MLIPSEQCAEPQKGSRPHRVRPIPRRRVPRNARNESGTAEEIMPLSLIMGDKGFFRCAHESGNAGIRVDS